MKRLCALLCALTLLCAGCAPAAPAAEDELVITAATYPVYLMVCAVTEGADGVRVERLNTGSVSCLHDYTLSVSDMKKIDRADVLALSGAELEDFMDDALALSSAAVIDCSAGVELLVSEGHDHEEHGHDHDHGHYDAHYWMAPANAQVMVDDLLAGLLPLLPDQADRLRANADRARAALLDCDTAARRLLAGTAGDLPGLITFHDGFAYFAHAYGLPLLCSIEEEAGSEASAKEIVEITRLVREHGIPVIFTEVNGSDATANAIARETGCAVARLSMLMDGPDVTPDGPDAVSLYTDGILSNINTIITGFAGGEAGTQP